MHSRTKPMKTEHGMKKQRNDIKQRHSAVISSVSVSSVYVNDFRSIYLARQSRKEQKKTGRHTTRARLRYELMNSLFGERICLKQLLIPLILAIQIRCGALWIISQIKQLIRTNEWRGPNGFLINKSNQKSNALNTYNFNEREKCANDISINELSLHVVVYSAFPCRLTTPITFQLFFFFFFH